MYIIAKLLAISNKIDKKDPSLADKLEKTAANMIDVFVPQSTLESGYKSVGGGNISGSLGGYHTQMQVTGGGNVDPAAITDATLFIGELETDLPSFDQWVTKHPNITSNPQQVYNILQIWQPFYRAGVTDIGHLQSVLNMSGPVNLQVATKSPAAAFSSWGITPQEIMQHEQMHATGEKSSPEAYMQYAIPGADFMNTNGIGGNINPVAGYYETLMQQFMHGQGPEEYGPNLNIWKRIVKEKTPR